jgi:hypothetical protein
VYDSALGREGGTHLSLKVQLRCLAEVFAI